MTALVWDKPEDRLFEVGVSKGVLYHSDGYGVPWNGLTSVEEGVETKVQPVFFDGVKFNDIVTIGEFKGTIKAFTYPQEFEQFVGTLEDQQGFFVTGQPQGTFSLSYRTEIDDMSGNPAHYKIHLLYNLTAIPSSKEYVTVSGDAVDPLEFQWDITAIPDEIENFLPTAHVIFDTRRLDPFLLSDLEAILYGDETHEARLPTLKSLATFVRTWDRLVVVDNGDGTWTASTTVPDVIVMLDDTTFQITADSAVYLDEDTYTLTSTDKNEDDLWPQ